MLKPEDRILNAQALAALAQKRVQRPNIEDLPTAFDNIQAGNLPDAFYDHVNDRVYVRILDKQGQPSAQYRAEDAIDPDPLNRSYRTVEDDV
jgi:hypothetical protein